MKLEIKNSEILNLINLINGFQNEVITCKGFRYEELTAGTKLRLSKIEKELVKHYTEFEKIRKSKVEEVYPESLTKEKELELVTNNDEVYLQLIKDITECSEDICTLDFDSITLSKVEDVKTTFDYSYLLEKIGE